VFKHNNDYNNIPVVCVVKVLFARADTVHMCLHTGERPCLCNVCSQTFGDKYTLLVHQVIHSEECPFV